MAFQINIPNEEAWNKEIASSQTGVVQGNARLCDDVSDDAFVVMSTVLLPTVVEVYQDWCGPCKAVMNSLKRQFFELGERPLKFYTVV